MIRLAYYEHPDYVPLLRRAYALWDELAEDAGEQLLFRTGGIYMGPPDGEVVPGATAAARLHGLDQRQLSHDDLRREHPLFTVPQHFTGVFEPEAGFVLCERSIGAFTRLAAASGARLQPNEPVTSIDLDGPVAKVTTSKGEYHAGRVVLTGGPWMSKLLPRHLPAVAASLTVTRQVLGWVQPPDPAPFALGRFPVWGIEATDGSLSYGFPIVGDVPGLKLARHGRGQPTDPDAVSRQITPADHAEVDAILRRNLPAGRGPMIDAKICLYTNSPDGHFIIDRLGDRAVIACGFSGHGFKFAPVIGEILADLATTGRTPLPIGFLAPRK
jgi:sarcosine oxidase